MSTKIKNAGDGLIQEIDERGKVIATYSEEYIEQLRRIDTIIESDYDPWENPLLKST